jgi:hypothetical protein
MLTVMIKVFEGGEGWTSGGKSERSRDRFALEPELARERTGVDNPVDICCAMLSSTVCSVAVFGVECSVVGGGSAADIHCLKYLKCDRHWSSSATVRMLRHLHAKHLPPQTCASLLLSFPRAFWPPPNLGVALPCTFEPVNKKIRPRGSAGNARRVSSPTGTDLVLRILLNEMKPC